MSDATLRVGVVGLGWAGVTHADAYALLPGVEVHALAAQEPERLATVGDRLDVPHRHTAWEDLVARDDLDVVSVAAPNWLHDRVAVAALEAGKHVLCEKPLALDAVRARSMVDAAVAADRVLWTVFNHRERGDVRTLRRFVDEGGLGRIYHVKASWTRRRHTTGDTWFTRKDRSGGGPLIDLGVHMLDLVLHLMDEPVVTRASGFTHAELVPASIAAAGGDPAGFEVEDLGGGTLRTQEGASVYLEASWALHAPVSGNEMTVSLHGTKGAATLLIKDYAPAGVLQISTDVAGRPAETFPVVPRGGGHADVVAKFVAAVRSGEWAAHRGVEGLRRSIVIDALYRSAEKDEEVDVAYEGGA
ncbi:Gfo/Idh/MocA family oxidoreductase [Planotetraspora phitsanulokensis]|uniref:Oxidoreductase n=1 Tax=Planotetraspora phitsanulokensis TaxID=575192 RepID=A0A8J3U8R6_9ACTN|nr:Gfo/Idh/MocA family oxidoreductase [Planotetraspora phitsanulokensis]GII40151.1 oxidoreductase [Planotetraspora phitsanulokensis]